MQEVDKAQEKKELRDEVYEWLRSIGYSATSREVSKLTGRLLKLSYHKLPEEEPKLSDEVRFQPQTYRADMSLSDRNDKLRI